MIQEEIKTATLRKGVHNSYWGNIAEAVITLWKGLRLTFSHLALARKRWYPVGVKEQNYFNHDRGVFTVRFPHETLAVPDTGRYKLHNEIDDCIVCDKCANICPVDCIEIESIRAVKEFGKTSDGTPRKIYAARFDIDMAKCCFCGLCTTVCPTECLTMTDQYDYSEYDIKKHIFSFATLSSEEILEKKKGWEEFEKSQAAAQVPSQQEITGTLEKKPDPGTGQPAGTAPGKPRFIPKMKPVIKPGPGAGQGKS